MHILVMQVAKKLGISETEVFMKLADNLAQAEWWLKAYRLSFKTDEELLRRCGKILTTED